MIKCKLGALFQLANTYTLPALESIGGVEYPSANKFAIGEFLTAIGPTLTRGQLTVQTLLAKYNGQIVESRMQVPTENAAAFNAEYAQLADTDVEIQSLPLSRKLFDKTAVTVGHLLALRPFLAEE